MNADDPRHGTYAGARAGCNCGACARAHYLYNVRLTQDHDRGVWRTVPARGFSRRTRALQALGWTLSDLEPRLGMPVSNIHRAAVMKEHILLSTHQRMVAVFEDLCMTLGPSSRMRVLAKNKGYLPPLVWDDIDNDPEPTMPGRVPQTRDHHLDEVAIERALTGDRSVTLTVAEKRAATALWMKRGRSLSELEQFTGWKADRYVMREAA